jgi:hypothetical protein
MMVEPGTMQAMPRGGKLVPAVAPYVKLGFGGFGISGDRGGRGGGGRWSGPESTETRQSRRRGQRRQRHGGVDARRKTRSRVPPIARLVKR